MPINFLYKYVIIVALSLFFIPTANASYIVENLDLQNMGDIVVGPGKIEVSLDPGESYTREILITNRAGKKQIFDISVEDFKASASQNGVIDFLGNEKGPYSLKDYVKPEITHIILDHGQRLRLPVLVSIPNDAEPGGLYGAVMVSSSNIDEEKNANPENAAPSAKVVTRVASLFLVKVNGEIYQEGFLKNFTVEKNFYEKGPVLLKMISQNNGNAHVSPYGKIEIKNILGTKVGEVNIDPWFVMPKSERTRELKWNSNFLIGKYTAVLSLSRGYGDLIDTASTDFWVIPWKFIAIIMIALILFIWLIIWLFTHLEFKKNPQKTVMPPPPGAVPPSQTMPPSQPV